MSHVRSSEFSRVGPFLVLAVTVLILYFARELLIPFAFALTLSFLLAPAVSRLEARRVPRVLAVAITGILAFTIICAVGYVVARQLLNVARSLPEYRTNIKDKIASVHSSALRSIEDAGKAIEDIGGDVVQNNPAPNSTQPPIPVQPVRIIDQTEFESTTGLFMRFLRPIGTFGVVIVFTIYLR
jgi:predicted PurR-regulated permease PerM